MAKIVFTREDLVKDLVESMVNVNLDIENEANIITKNYGVLTKGTLESISDSLESLSKEDFEKYSTEIQQRFLETQGFEVEPISDFDR